MKNLSLVFFVVIILTAVPVAAATDTSTGWIEKGDALARTGRYDTAIHAYTRAIGINPNDPKGYIARGRAYARLKKNRQAVDDYNKAVALDLDSAESFFARGQFLFRTLGEN